LGIQGWVFFFSRAVAATAAAARMVTGCPFFFSLSSETADGEYPGCFIILSTHGQTLVCTDRRELTRL